MVDNFINRRKASKKEEEQAIFGDGPGSSIRLIGAVVIPGR
jgi:hypothetical protein